MRSGQLRLLENIIVQTPSIMSLFLSSTKSRTRLGLRNPISLPHPLEDQPRMSHHQTINRHQNKTALHQQPNHWTLRKGNLPPLQRNEQTFIPNQRIDRSIAIMQLRQPKRTACQDEEDSQTHEPKEQPQPLCRHLSICFQVLRRTIIPR